VPEADYIEKILGKDGLLTRAWPGFVAREGQVMGAYPVDGAIRNRARVMIEAPTGTGKTLMYLVPATYHAAYHGRRAVVVTANLTLSKQLIAYDLPRLATTLPWRFTYAELKGRQNFVCRKRAEAERQELSPGWTREEKAQVKEVLAWEDRTLSGDKSDLKHELLRKVEKRLFVTSDDCDRERCPFFGSRAEDAVQPEKRCFAESARTDAMDAQIVVTNYRMLCLHLRGYAAVLPPFDIAILDEAHMAADVARATFGFDMHHGAFSTAVQLLRTMEEDDDPELFKKEETIETPIEDPDAAEAPVDEEAMAQGALAVSRIDLDSVNPTALAGEILGLGQTFFRKLGDLRDAAPAALPYDNFVPGWEELRDKLRLAARLYTRRADNLHEKGARSVAIRYDKAAASSWNLSERVEHAMTLKDSDGFVYYVDEDDDERVSLCQRAILVDQIFQSKLFTPGRSVIMTSATLRTGGTFNHVARDLGVPETPQQLLTATLPSPFNMAEQARLILPSADNDRMPGPTDKGFDEMVVRILRHAIKLAHGRTMALFTSRQRLQYVAKNLGDVGYQVLVQGAPGAMQRGALLDEFKRDIHSVLLATGSFWAGVDVPGEALSLLVIDKLPFEADDPLSSAIKQQLRKRGLSPFQHWIVPRAILTLKQGLGRLIRATGDRGVMMLLDNRITRKSYGAQFLRSLDLPPACIVNRTDVIAEFLGEVTEDSVEKKTAGRLVHAFPEKQ
jgi:ATP-dependent DNA helicase DinG